MASNDLASLPIPPDSVAAALAVPPDATHSGGQAPGYAESLARGVAQGGTLGFADELAGAGGSLVDAGTNLSVSDLVKNYIQHRDQYRQADAAAKAANPKTFTGGMLGGGLATAFVPGLNIGKAATIGGRVLGAVGLGATAGLGNSNADLTSGVPSQYVEAGKDVAKGAAIGGALQGLVGEPLQYALSGRMAQDLAVRHLRPTAQMARSLGQDRLRDIGQEALDSGAIKFGSKVSSTADNLATASNEAGATLGDIVEASGATVDPHAVAQRFQSEVIDPLKGTAANQNLVNTLEEQKQAFLDIHAPQPPEGAEIAAEAAKVPVQNIEAEKRAVQGNINYKTDPNAKTGAMRDWARILKQSSENAINSDDFTAAKRAYGNLESAQTMAERTAGLANGGNGLLGHITDVGLGTEALHLAANGNPAGLAIGAGRALTRGRISSSGAVLADQFAKGGKAISQALNGSEIVQKLQGIPGAARFAGAIKSAASQGQGALAATHFILSQTEPAYQQAVNGGE